MLTERSGSGVGAAILAAGLGERMSHTRVPKPLVRLGGISLLERAYRTLRLGGILGTIAVVVGHRGDEIARFARNRDLDVEIIENPRFRQGNGTSVLAAVPDLPERFVVAMADHIHTPASVRALLACQGDFVAAVDTRPAHADHEEATRVRLRSGEVIAVGKGLEPYDALDTGLFLCSGPALQQLAVPMEGELSWNAIKRLWLKSGRAIEACDLSGTAWIDVDCSPDLGRALEVVMATVGSGGEGYVSHHINRKVSTRITRVLLTTPITADQMSTIAFLTAAGGAGSMLGNRWRLGSALVQLSSILDGCDGELARARLEGSPRGAVLDATLDRWADALIISGMAIGAGNKGAHWAGYPAVAGALLVPYTRAKMEAELGEMPREMTHIGATRDVRLAALALGALLGRPLPSLVAVAIGSNIEVARRLFALGRVRGRETAPFS